MGDCPQGMGKGGWTKGGQHSLNYGSKGCEGIKANAVASDFDKTGITGLSNEQWATLKTLLSTAQRGTNEKSTGKCSTTQWIIDSGASHHMRGCLDCPSDVQIIIDCPVGLPNGKQAAATNKGTMMFNNKLALHHVLYVPSLTCNLISLSQLLNESNCVAQFTDKLCVIQDCTSRMVISVGEQREGLCFFRDMVTAAAMQINGRSSFDLWHKRLGHPSFRVVEMFPNVGSSKNSTLSNKVCEVCLRAKQCRDSFPTSTDKTSVIF